VPSQTKGNFLLWKRLYATFTQLEPFETLSLHIVPRQCLTTCVYEWKKDPLISGCLFLTTSTHRYRINVPFSTIGSQKKSKNHLRPLHHGSKKIKELVKNPTWNHQFFSHSFQENDGSLKIVKNPTRWAVILFYLKPQTWGFLKF
jgi:hypothetical protein